MAERRMFAKTIIDSDAFLDMSVTARLLYYDLSMRADDDGFVNSPKKIMRMVGAAEDDLRMLVARKFIIPFDNGVVVIKHWKIHNYIRKDMYHETKYKEEKSMLELDENNAYTMASVTIPLQTCNEYVTNPSTQVRLGKDSIGNSTTNKFVPPTPEEVEAYINEKGYNVDANRFVDFYQSKGWMVGKSKMKDWKAAVRNWSRDSKPKAKEVKSDDRGYTMADLIGY